MVTEARSATAQITIYHDPYSKRLRIDDYAGDIEDVIALIEKSVEPWVEKLIVKSRPKDVPIFEEKGYRIEAIIKKYYCGIDMYFVTRYFSGSRQTNPKESEEARLVQQLLQSKPEAHHSTRQTCTYATIDDASALAELYKSSFSVYPTPVGDPEYIKGTIQDGTVYVFIREGGRLISAASAEINRKYHNAELTDCATSSEGQGKGYMRALLTELEEHLKAQGITCLYTIARSESFAMNKVFFQLGYTYGGRMTNNCMIYSGLEDMNVWYKS